MFKKLLYPNYYAARDIADFIKNRSLAHYLFHIQPYMRNNIWFPSCYSENDTIDKHQIGDLLILKLVDAFKNCPPTDIISIDDLYTNYTNKNKSQMVVSKQYFEKYIRFNLTEYIVYDSFVDFRCYL